MLDVAPLFAPITINGMELPNRFVLPAMQRKLCENGEPKPELVDYFRRCAEGGVSLIITEAAAIDHRSATQEPTYARITPQTIAAWARCVDVVRRAGGKMFFQLWHEGAVRREGGDGPYADAPTLSPSGIRSEGRLQGRAATLDELAEIRESYVRSALLAKEAGAAGVEIHACHGYLLDQFLWSVTNRREDGYGGDDFASRLRYPAEVVAAVRAAVGPDYPMSFRFSQWKQADYSAKIVRNVQDLALLTRTIAAAGTDMFHVSTRRFYTPEWEHSPLGLAGWTKSVTSLPVIACGSVGLDTDVMDNMMVREARQTGEAGIDELVRRFENEEFDLISVGRANIGDPDFVTKIRDGRLDEIRMFSRADIMPATRAADGTRLY